MAMDEHPYEGLTPEERAMVEKSDESARLKIDMSMKRKTGRFDNARERSMARRLFGLDAVADSEYRISRW